MQPCDYQETWLDRLISGLLVAVAWSPLVAIVVVSGIAVAKDHPPAEVPFEFLLFTVAVAGLIAFLAAVGLGTLIGLLSPSRKK